MSGRYGIPARCFVLRGIDDLGRDRGLRVQTPLVRGGLVTPRQLPSHVSIRMHACRVCTSMPMAWDGMAMQPTDTVHVRFTAWIQSLTCDLHVASAACRPHR